MSLKLYYFLLNNFLAFIFYLFIFAVNHEIIYYFLWLSVFIDIMWWFDNDEKDIEENKLIHLVFVIPIINVAWLIISLAIFGVVFIMESEKRLREKLINGTKHD